MRVYLSQLFIQVRGVHLSAFSQLLVKHLLVPADEIGAKKFLHLHRYIHGHGDDVIKQNHEGQEVCEGSDHLSRGRETNSYEVLSDTRRLV